MAEGRAKLAAPLSFALDAMTIARVASIAALLATAASAAGAAELTVTVLDRSGKPLPEAVVQVDSTLPGARPSLPTELTIAQEKMRFMPAVTIAPLGAKVSFSNLDSWDHHVIAGPMGPGGVYLDESKNTQMRLAGRLAGKAPSTDSRTFTQPGPLLLGCHLHGSMRGHLFVADSPWARLSGDDGRARIADLPEGPARVRIWHADQLVETPVQATTVAAGGSQLTIATQIAARAKKSAPAAATSNFPY